MTRDEIRTFVRKHKKRTQRLLWWIAEKAPFGGNAIVPDGDPYLLRIYLTPSLRRWGLPRPYLHYFFRGDNDLELHNHPWRFSISLILTGGYTEWRWNPQTKEVEVHKLRPGDLNFIRRDDYHRVALTVPREGCWTLFITKDRVHAKDGADWGFLNTDTGEYTPWGIFVQKRSIMAWVNRPSSVTV